MAALSLGRFSLVYYSELCHIKDMKKTNGGTEVLKMWKSNSGVVHFFKSLVTEDRGIVLEPKSECGKPIPDGSAIEHISLGLRFGLKACKNCLSASPVAEKQANSFGIRG